MSQAFSLDGKMLLVTAGTGSFGCKFADILLEGYQPRKLMIAGVSAQALVFMVPSPWRGVARDGRGGREGAA